MEKLEELSAVVIDEELVSDGMDLDERLGSLNGEMDVDDDCSRHDELVKNIGKVVRDLRSLGFASIAENAYASSIFWLLKVLQCTRVFVCLTETYKHVSVWSVYI